MICDATLVFQLTTARGALPVQGAGILVTDPATGRNTYLTTDPSGRSRVLCVTVHIRKRREREPVGKMQRI